ncbi:MAG: two-component system sensor histidine kinase CreC [Verrucomicrobiales bacterium]|nr:two-component system sensor histidine kinase CreC [Verrucomicrobiales bacterium]
MKITILILSGFLAVAVGSLAFLARKTRNNIYIQYSQASEEPLVDFAHLFASLIERDIKDGKIDPSRFRESFRNAYNRDFIARIYNLEKSTIQTNVYVTDENGIVIFDSENGKREGEDYSQFNDVYLSWQGQYGVRSSRVDVNDSRTSVFFIGAPIRDGDKMIGTLSVSRPETAMAPFANESRDLVVKWSLMAAVFTMVLGALWVYWLLHPIRNLTEHARLIARGESRQLPITGRAELRKLSLALEEMRRELEGKHYVENYVQALTHELKSPLAAIRGAAELIDESMPPEKRAHFLDNILSETARSEDLVRRLVQLASLESQSSLATIESVSLVDLVREAIEDSAAALESRNLEVVTDFGDGGCTVEGDPLMLRIAFRNILNNAIDFSPHGGRLEVKCVRKNSDIVVSVADQGPGIPEYALNRVFERFYSLKNKTTGRKGSGIGLCFTKESMDLHGGEVSLENRDDDSGAVATLVFRNQSS